MKRIFNYGLFASLRVTVYLILGLVASVPMIQAGMRYDLPARPDILALSEKIALAEVGTRETGHNRGPVEKYSEPFGRGYIGAPYCAMGQYWTFWKAAGILGEYSLIPIPKTAIASEVYNYAKRHGRQRDYIAERNCLLFWKMRSSYQGHEERIRAVIDKRGNVKTIGFNTGGAGPGGERDGEGVDIKTRNIYNRLGRLQISGIIGFTPPSGGAST